MKRRQAIAPAIGHTQTDQRMDRCWMRGASGDALHALTCGPGLQHPVVDEEIAGQSPAGFAVAASNGRCGMNNASAAARTGGHTDHLLQRLTRRPKNVGLLLG